jgi:hypothetical protein
MMIGDYDEQSETSAICLLAERGEVEASPLKEDDEVTLHAGAAATTDGGDGAPEASPATTPGGGPGRFDPGTPDQCAIRSETRGKEART